MNSKTNNKREPNINPVDRKTNEEIDTAEDGTLIIGGEKEHGTEKPKLDNFDGVED